VKPELLLPAGDLEKLKTAFLYGADAVYAGVPVFSLRARENKFNIDSVKEAVDYTRSLKKTIYLTLNIYPRNYKIPALKKALRPLADLKPDAFIVADPGVIKMCKEICPEIPLHLSVQQNNVNWASAQFWHQQGISRIILSREITLNEISEIHEKNPGLELETFVHGSICMAYSGRCLLSNYMTYRDANQGTCAHSCRWKYKAYLEEMERPGQFMPIEEDEHGSYIMSSKDLCLIEYLKDLKEAGVCSFKVEGRNKTPYYVATVAKTYRKAIDEMVEGKPFNHHHITELSKTSNRGFFPGFLIQNPQEKAQEYDKRSTMQTHEFVGIIRGIEEREHRKLYKMEVKGRLDVPEEVEVMTPEKDINVELKEFINPYGESLKTVHPGQKDQVLVELPEEAGIGTIIRKKREQ
jgi:putative protease